MSRGYVHCSRDSANSNSRGREEQPLHRHVDLRKATDSGSSSPIIHASAQNQSDGRLTGKRALGTCSACAQGPAFRDTQPELSCRVAGWVSADPELRMHRPLTHHRSSAANRREGEGVEGRGGQGCAGRRPAARPSALADPAPTPPAQPVEASVSRIECRTATQSHGAKCERLAARRCG